MTAGRSGRLAQAEQARQRLQDELVEAVEIEVPAPPGRPDAAWLDAEIRTEGLDEHASWLRDQQRETDAEPFAGIEHP